MKPIKTLPFSVFLLAGMLLSCSPQNTTELKSAESLIASQNATISQLDAMIVDLNTELNGLKNRLTENEIQLKNALDYLEATKKQLAQSENKTKQLEDTLGIKVFSGIQPSYNKSITFNNPFALVSNPDSINPTWDSLVDFVYLDQTDTFIYKTDDYMCGTFAETVYNNAHQKGIKAGVAIVWFEGTGPVHALNVFKTSDKGLVFIDCTGGREPYFEVASQIKMVMGDKIAYISKGKEMGALGLGRNISADYPYYLEMKSQWVKQVAIWTQLKTDIKNYNELIVEINKGIDNYNTNVKSILALDPELLNKIKLASKQRFDIEVREQRLEDELHRLDYMYGSMGTVKSVEIYW